MHKTKWLSFGLVPLLLMALPQASRAGSVDVSQTNVALDINEAVLPDVNGTFSGQFDAAQTAGGTLTYSLGIDEKITVSLGGTLALGPTGIEIDVKVLQGDTVQKVIALLSGSSSSGDLLSSLTSESGTVDLSYSAVAGVNVAPGAYSGTLTYTVISAI